MSIPATYIDGTHFTVEGEFDGEYPWGRRIQAGQGVDDIAYTHVISATYSAVTDLVTIEVGHDVLTVNLVSIHRGVGNKLSLGLHYHDSDTTDAGYMAASRLDDDAVDILLTLGAVPTGTGFRHVTADAEDPTVKLVENADVDASAAIAESKLALDYATADLNADIVTAQATADAAIPSAEKGAVDGVCPLDGTGLVDGDDLPAASVSKKGSVPILENTGTKVLYDTGVWAVPPGAGGGEANTISSQGGGVSLYKQKTGIDLELNSLDSSQFSLVADVISYVGAAGSGSDVRLVRSLANRLSLVGVPGTSKILIVNGTNQDLSTPKTLDTDSATDYLISESGGTVSIGSTALSALTTGYNDWSWLYLFVTDNSSQWNFSSPTSKDYRNSLIISDKAPTEQGGYMAASGDGVGARHVGWCILNATRQLLEAYYVASAFNEQPTVMQLSGDNLGSPKSTALTSIDWMDNVNAGDPRMVDYLPVPEGWRITADVRVLCQNSVIAKHCYYRVLGDDGFEARCGVQRLPVAGNYYVGSAGGFGEKTYSVDTVVYLKTQTGAQSDSGSSGNAETSDMNAPTVFIVRFPR